MNLSCSCNRVGAFTLVEMLVVCAIIGILAAMLMPALEKGKERARRIQCINNLRESGVAFHLFANDHNGKFPMEVSTNDGGSLEFARAGYQSLPRFNFSYRHFLALAEEIKNPNVLLCPADLARFPASSFSSFNNSNLSYVVGLKADTFTPNAILSGDRNFPGAYYVNQTIVHIPTSTSYYLWQQGSLHNAKGNLLFADAHVEESYNAPGVISSEESVTEDIVVPDIKGTLSPFVPYQYPGLGGNNPVSHPDSPTGRTGPGSQNSGGSGTSPSATPSSPNAPAFTPLPFSSPSPSPASPPMSQSSSTSHGVQPPLSPFPATPALAMPRVPMDKGSVQALPPLEGTPKAVEKEATYEMAFPAVLAESAHQSWDATGWLLWLILLLLVLILVARWLDRRWQRKRAYQRRS